MNSTSGHAKTNRNLPCVCRTTRGTYGKKRRVAPTHIMQGQHAAVESGGFVQAGCRSGCCVTKCMCVRVPSHCCELNAGGSEHPHIATHDSYLIVLYHKLHRNLNVSKIIFSQTHTHTHMTPYPELVINAGRVLLDESSVVGGDVPMVAVLLQHVYFGFNLLLLVLRRAHTHTEGEEEEEQNECDGICILSR